MKKYQKATTAILAAVLLAATALTGCGGKDTAGSSPSPSEAEASDTNTDAANAETGAETEAGTETGTGSTADSGADAAGGVVTVAATSVPHAEILEAAVPLMEAAGWTLEITIFSDYVLPNEAVEAGDFDCNFFQHTPYLDSFNQEKGSHLVNAGEIHYEPLGIYGGTASDLAAVPDNAVIAVPNDTTNEARALLLLQDNGLISIDPEAGMTATVNDIVENPHNIEFVELEAAQVPRMIEEVSYVVLNGNYALQAGLNAGSDALAYETADSEAARTYVNIVVVKEGNEDHPGVKALVDILKGDQIKQFINDNYQGAVVPF